MRGVDSWRDEVQSGTLRIVARDIAVLQLVLAAAMAAPLAVSLLYGEYHSALSFLIAGLVTAAASGTVYRICRDAPDPERHHALLIAGAGWLVAGMFGGLPFLIAAWITPDSVAARLVPLGADYTSSLVYFRNPLHALFESMSAYTTTGLTMAVHEPSVGHGILFYRSLAQWIGGVGVIVLSLAIIPRPRAVGGLELYQSETAGMKLRPSILGTARLIWKIYAVLTLFSAAVLFLSTMLALPDYGVAKAIFDSVNHAMTGQATGGFSTLDDSIAGYGSYVVELAHLVPMLLGVTSIPLYYAFLRERDLRVFWGDAQFRLMLIILAITIPLLTIFLIGNPAAPDAFRTSLFQIVSALSGTGFQTSDIGAWGSSAVLLIGFGTMIVGGAAGSTAGGFKLIRAYVLLRAIGWRVRKVFLPPEAVLPFKVGPRYFPMQAMVREVADAAVISFLYIIVLAASMIAVGSLVGPEFTLGDAIFECISAQGTVGLSTGITHPEMPVSVEIIFILQMWVGRLEIFPVVVLLSAVYSWIVRR